MYCMWRGWPVFPRCLQNSVVFFRAFPRFPCAAQPMWCYSAFATERGIRTNRPDDTVFNRRMANEIVICSRFYVAWLKHAALQHSIPKNGEMNHLKGNTHLTLVFSWASHVFRECESIGSVLSKIPAVIETSRYRKMKGIKAESHYEPVQWRHDAWCIVRLSPGVLALMLQLQPITVPFFFLPAGLFFQRRFRRSAERMDHICLPHFRGGATTFCQWGQDSDDCMSVSAIKSNTKKYTQHVPCFMHLSGYFHVTFRF